MARQNPFPGALWGLIGNGWAGGSAPQPRMRREYSPFSGCRCLNPSAAAKHSSFCRRLVNDNRPPTRAFDDSDRQVLDVFIPVVAHLVDLAQIDPNRVAGLEEKRAELEDELRALDEEADRAEVPQAWRD